MNQILEFKSLGIKIIAKTKKERKKRTKTKNERKKLTILKDNSLLELPILFHGFIPYDQG
jgi:hypothetical protein